MSNPFFKNNGPILILDILKILNINLTDLEENAKINDIKDLSTSNELDVTFFHSQKYKELAKKTKASFCITTEFLKNERTTSDVPCSVENVQVSVSKIKSIFQPDAVHDDCDNGVLKSS